MISIEKALGVASEKFPYGVEALAEGLGVKIVKSQFSGCEGWCLRHSKKIIVRINSKASEARQRFTLAHELAHIILQLNHRIHDTFTRTLQSNNHDERFANQLAGQLLLPTPRLNKLVTCGPIHRREFGKIGKKARLSEIVLGIRISEQYHELGLTGASVVGFRGGKPTWFPVRSFPGIKSIASSIKSQLEPKGSNSQIIKTEGEHHFIGFSIGSINGSTYFIQRSTIESSLRETKGQTIRRLATEVFGNDSKVCASVQGCLSQYSKKLGNNCRIPLDLAIAGFNEKYLDRWGSDESNVLRSVVGQNYLRLRLAEWCPEPK